MKRSAFSSDLSAQNLSRRLRRSRISRLVTRTTRRSVIKAITSEAGFTTRPRCSAHRTPPKAYHLLGVTLLDCNFGSPPSLGAEGGKRARNINGKPIILYQKHHHIEHDFFSHVPKNNFFAITRLFVQTFPKRRTETGKHGGSEFLSRSEGSKDATFFHGQGIDVTEILQL